MFFPPGKLFKIVLKYTENFFFECCWKRLREEKVKIEKIGNNR